MVDYEITVGLDRAAFLIMQGAELVAIVGKDSWNCRFTIKLNNEIMVLDGKGLVNYRQFIKARKRLKRKMYKAYNIIK